MSFHQNASALVLIWFDLLSSLFYSTLFSPPFYRFALCFQFNGYPLELPVSRHNISHASLVRMLYCYGMLSVCDVRTQRQIQYIEPHLEHVIVYCLIPSYINLIYRKLDNDMLALHAANLHWPIYIWRNPFFAGVISSIPFVSCY